MSFYQQATLVFLIGQIIFAIIIRGLKYHDGSWPKVENTTINSYYFISLVFAILCQTFNMFS